MQWNSTFRPKLCTTRELIKSELRMDQPTNFGPFNEEVLAAINAMKDALLSPPVLAIPIFIAHMTLDTDACDKRVGCVLLQKQEDKIARPIGYWSRSLNNAGKKYETT